MHQDVYAFFFLSGFAMLPAGGGALGVGATVIQCTQTCDVTNAGTVVGEPHFVGFDGSRYDFQGEHILPSACTGLSRESLHYCRP